MISPAKFRDKSIVYIFILGIRCLVYLDERNNYIFIYLFDNDDLLLMTKGLSISEIAVHY